MVQLGGKGGQFVIVGGKKAPAFINFMEVFDHRPRNRQTVKGCRPTADFIQDHQGAVGCLIKDRGGFDHFNHEGRTTACQIVRRPHTGKQPVNHADMGLGRRDKGPDLGQNRNQGVLAQEGRFTGHIRTGDQPQALFILKAAIIGDKGRVGIFAKGGLDHRVTPGGNIK